MKSGTAGADMDRRLHQGSNVEFVILRVMHRGLAVIPV